MHQWLWQVLFIRYAVFSCPKFIKNLFSSAWVILTVMSLSAFIRYYSELPLSTNHVDEPTGMLHIRLGHTTRNTVLYIGQAEWPKGQFAKQRAVIYLLLA